VVARTPWLVALVIGSAGAMGACTTTVTGSAVPGPATSATPSAQVTSNTAKRPPPGTRVFDAEVVSDGVLLVLTNNYQVTATKVVCPADQPVIVNATFVCQATIDGAPVPITITVKNSNGTYEVGQPGQ
jgi:hypothetical protein